VILINIRFSLDYFQNSNGEAFPRAAQNLKARQLFFESFFQI